MMNEKVTSSGILGIDAGGTFTDFAFVDGTDFSIKARCKITTNHNNLIETIEAGLDEILSTADPEAIRSLNVATTLATNAIVENRFEPAALILIGYNEKIVAAAEFRKELNTDYVFLIQGGHDANGDEMAPLDETALRKAILDIPEKIKAVAISAFFSVRNSSHEFRAVELVRQLRPDISISCGHELSTSLDAVKRATTAALNAGLIPVVSRFLSAVSHVCGMRGLDVPVTILKGDGTIVSAQWAKEHPVEMILSGPAASACGASFLASQQDGTSGRISTVIDMGGTTTDMIQLDSSGRPVLVEEGAAVAGHRTLVKAIDINTFGLGGDTRVLCDEEGQLYLENCRVKPLCVLAEEYPDIVNQLAELAEKDGEEPLFLLKGTGSGENEFENRILNNLKEGPKSRTELLTGEKVPWLRCRQIDRMEEKGLIQYAAFTPTDALHVIGTMTRWNREASLAGARCLAGMAGTTAVTAAVKIKIETQKKIAKAFLRNYLKNMGLELETAGSSETLLEAAVSEEHKLFRQIQFFPDIRLIGVGAPSEAFLPAVGNLVNLKTVLLENGDIAGAVGAAAGSFLLEYSVKIIPNCGGEIFRVHHPAGIADFEELEEAVDFARNYMEIWLTERARNAGAAVPVISVKRTDKSVSPGKKGKTILLYTELAFSVTDKKC